MNNLAISIYPSKDQGFLVSYTHPLTKRKIRQSFSLKWEAQDFKKRAEEKFSGKDIQSYQDMTIEDAIVLLLKEKPRNPFSKKGCHFIDFIDTFGEFKVHDVTSEALKTWLDQVQREGSLKEITIRKLKCEIDTLFAFLIEKDVISESPLSKIYYKKEAPPLKARNLLSEKEIEKLLKELKAYSPGYLYPIVKLFAETGAKTTEVAELRWDDVDLEHGEVKFPKREKNQGRKLKLSKELISILKKRKRASPLIFQTYYKEAFTAVKLTRAINDFKAKSHFTKSWCVMDLRHSYAVSFLKTGGSMKELQYILGHQKVYDTKRLYDEASRVAVAKDVTNPFE